MQYTTQSQFEFGNALEALLACLNDEELIRLRRRLVKKGGHERLVELLSDKLARWERGAAGSSKKAEENI